MTVTLALLGALGVTVALLVEEWSWRRFLRRRARAEMARLIDEMHAGGATVRCLMHATPLVVEDLGAHIRLHHQRRAVGVEDRPEWSA
jgi:hypothetical protein